MILQNNLPPRLAVRCIWQMLGGIASGLIGAYSQNKTNNKALRHQTSERIASQRWQDQQRIAQNRFAIDTYLKYQSPEALVRQYESAGLNPRLAADSSGQLSPASGSSGSAPMGGSVPLQSPFSPSTFGAGFTDIARALRDLSEAKNLGIDTEFLERTLQDRVKKEAFGAEAIALSNTLKGLDIQWYDKEHQATYQKLLTDIAQGNITVDKVRAELRGLGIKNDILQNELDTWFENYTNRQNQIKSVTALNESGVRLNDEMAKTEPYKRGLIQTQTSTEQARARLFDAEQSRVLQDLQLYKPMETLARFQDDVVSGRTWVTPNGRVVGDKGETEYLPDSVLANYAKQLTDEFALAKDMPEFTRKRIEEEIDRLTKTNDWYEVMNITQIIWSLASSYASVKTGINIGMLPPSSTTSSVRFDAGGHRLGSSINRTSYER